jgi:hypothetical protein
MSSSQTARVMYLHNTERKHISHIIVSPTLWEDLLHATNPLGEELPCRCRVRNTWEVWHITSFVNVIDIKHVGIENCMQCMMHASLKSKKHNYVQ